jgi:hypothetical protein
MVGARVGAGALRGDDFHETPREAVEALLSVEVFCGPIWEPACGRGAISQVLEEHGHEVISTDLVDRGYGRGGIDFLMEWQPLAPSIVTNPPFKLALEFARRACDLASDKVALLGRLAWLEGRARRKLFEITPLARVWIFSRRLPMMHRDGYVGPRSTSTIAYAWFVWERAHVGLPSVGWLPREPQHREGG